MATLADIADPTEALREAGRRYRALALAHPMVYQLMFLGAVPGFEPARRPGRPPGLRGLVATVRRAMAERAWWPTGRRQMAQVIWAAIHGWVSLELGGLIFLSDVDAGAEAMARSLIAGFQVPPD